MKTVETANKATENKNGVNSSTVKPMDGKAAAAGIKPNTGFDAKAATAEKDGKAAASAAPKAVGAAVATQPEAKPAAAGELKAAEQPQPAKPALNLENTLKLVEELHRRKRQRDRLIETIDNLEAFEVEQQEESDETDGNYYQGCKLVVEDDNRNQFATKNPVIIGAVATFVRDMCTQRLAEIEADIKIPY
ncbi:hypothetical protein [Parapedobacter sp. DT-150]|uniref:hypothetical protein n=1 Tax=Parapedobacter sp. DT-150 TaxID=3396162 RepID=UPI003F1BEB3A